MLPYSIEQEHSRFSPSGSGGWDPTGVKAHTFRLYIKKKDAELETDDNPFDCKKFVRNIDLMFGEFLRSVTFHPSYSYEEFVEGIRPKLNSEEVSYNLEDGIFKQINNQALFDPENKYVLIIDEVNRGNIPKIFGELITLIEDEKREKYSLNLTYSKDNFTVAKNLKIIGTMNTADASIAKLDIALRRRFLHKELMPDTSLIAKSIGSKPVNLQKVVDNLNEKIRTNVGRERQIGHAYFMKNGKAIIDIATLKERFAQQIIPLIQEYFYEDWKEIGKILGPKFIDSDKEIVVEDWKTNDGKFEEALDAI